MIDGLQKGEMTKFWISQKSAIKLTISKSDTVKLLGKLQIVHVGNIVDWN